MFSSLKTCVLIEIICLSFCEASRIKRSFPVNLPPILNPPGSNSLSPVINITIVIDIPQTTCCTSCNPPPTHEPCETCPPPTTCKPCEICPTVTTCEPCTTPSPATTCEPCTTPTPVITCEPCSTPPPTTCEPCETCPTSTTREPNSTSCPTAEMVSCISVGGIVCTEGNWCIIPTIYEKQNYVDAVKNCSSLDNTYLAFEIPDHKTVKEDKMICIRNAFRVEDFENQNTFWSLMVGSVCYITLFIVENETIAQVDETFPEMCNYKDRFYCVADL